MFGAVSYSLVEYVFKMVYILLDQSLGLLKQSWPCKSLVYFLCQINQHMVNSNQCSVLLLECSIGLSKSEKLWPLTHPAEGLVCISSTIWADGGLVKHWTKLLSLRTIFFHWTYLTSVHFFLQFCCQKYYWNFVQMYLIRIDKWSQPCFNIKYHQKDPKYFTPNNSICPWNLFCKPTFLITAILWKFWLVPVNRKVFVNATERQEDEVKVMQRSLRFWIQFLALL